MDAIRDQERRQELLLQLMDFQNKSMQAAIELQRIERRGPQPAASASGRGGPALVVVEKAG